MRLLNALGCLNVSLLVGLCSLVASTQTLATPRVALVLSGGGARGGAHVGVLKALEEHQIPIDLIVGTSFGALVGALYATGYSADDIDLILRQIDWDDLLADAPERQLLDVENKRRSDRSLFHLTLQNSELNLPTGLQSGQKIRQLLDRLTAFAAWEAGNDFDRLAVPFRAVATDILTGKAYVFSHGSISESVRASIAVPGLFTPVEVGEMLLLDGGIANNLPVDVARNLGAEIVIAVDVSTPLRQRKEQIQSVLDILDQAISIHIEERKVENLKLADLVIAPDLSEFTASEFSRIGEMIPYGYRAAETKLASAIGMLPSPSHPIERRPRIDPATFDLKTYQASNRILRPDRVEVSGLRKQPQLDREIRRGAIAVTLNRLDRKVARLYGTNRFRAVNYQLEMKGDKTILAYQLEEAPATELGLGVRYDRDFNFTGAMELTSRDVRGSRNDLNLFALIGNAKLARLELSNRSLTRHFVVSPSVFARSFERKLFMSRTPIGEFEDRRAGFRLAASRQLGETAQIEAAYHLARVDLDGIEGDRLQKRPESLAGLELLFEFDSLDDVDFPTSGWTARFSGNIQSKALGSSYGFRQYRAQTSHHLPFGSRSVVTLSGSWGLAQGDVPVYEQFFTGGSHYLSFSAEPFIGLDRGQRRSRHVVNLGLEYRRNWKRFQLGFLQKIDWSLKYDAGLFSQEGQLTEFQSLLHGLGGGIHLKTRFLGPVSLQFGGTNEGDFNTYVSIGHSF